MARASAPFTRRTVANDTGSMRFPPSANRQSMELAAKASSVSEVTSTTRMDYPLSILGSILRSIWGSSCGTREWHRVTERITLQDNRAIVAGYSRLQFRYRFIRADFGNLD